MPWQADPTPMRAGTTLAFVSIFAWTVACAHNGGAATGNGQTAGGAAAAADTAADTGAAAASATPALEGTDWILVELGDKPAVPGATGTPPTLRFDAAGGRLSGSGGCNRITGTYRVDGDRLTFGPIASTRMACPEAMDQEQAFLKALAGVTSYRSSGGTLDLLDGSNVLARLRAGSP
jgi:heat shock protein HslJ